MNNVTTQESEQVEAHEESPQVVIDTESMTLQELLDYRYSLPPDERRTIKANRSIAGDTKKIMLWSFHCAFQDRPVLVILAISVLVYHAFKLVIDMVKAII